MTIKNAYNLTPDQVQAGDVYLFTAKLMVSYVNSKGQPVYRIYRCPYEYNISSEPQGSRIDLKLEKAVMQALFPVVGWANGKQDT